MVSETVDGFTRMVLFSRAFDERSTDPSKNYGVHGVNLQFVLRGPVGAVQFVLYTNWQLPRVTVENYGSYAPVGNDYHWRERPTPADLGYHAYTPQYDGQKPVGPCHILTDAADGCYYDGSTLNAEPVFTRLLEEGDDGVWAELLEFYHAQFSQTEAGQT